MPDAHGFAGLRRGWISECHSLYEFYSGVLREHGIDGEFSDLDGERKTLWSKFYPPGSEEEATVLSVLDYSLRDGGEPLTREDVVAGEVYDYEIHAMLLAVSQGLELPPLSMRSARSTPASQTVRTSPNETET